MNILIISGNPKQDGLCHSITEAAKSGALEAGAKVTEIPLCDMHLIRCQVCDDGWGTCYAENKCAFGSDGFTQIQDSLRNADALILATPVYWGETSEALKSFLDRLRRCEFGQTGALSGKQAILIASAGGTGNGILTCLEQMEQFCRHTSTLVFDRFGINRWNSDYQSQSVARAAKALAAGRCCDDTV